MNSDEFNVMACYIGNAPTNIDAIGETKLEYVKSGNGYTYNIINQDYESPLTMTLTLIKKDKTEIDTLEQRQLINWLCHDGLYKDFTIDKQEYEDIVYKANISNPKLMLFGDVKAMQFTLTTNSPFAHTSIINKNFQITSANKNLTININSDNNDYIYPVLEIEMLQSGNLEISNNTEPNHFRITEIKNVTVGEKITINSELPTIATSTGRQIYDSFNKFWIRLVNGVNTLNFNLNCNVKISYQEVRKVGLY